MAIKVAMVSLGCPKNQVDAEILLHELEKGGYKITTNLDSCDVVVINTCGFIKDAKQESIDNILEYCQLKQENKIKCVVVTGCLAERYQNEIQDEIPEIDVCLGLGSNKDIVSAIDKAMKGQKVFSFGDKTGLSLDGERVVSTLPYYAYLKIAEGCDNNCSYCAIPSIRGRFRSRSIESVLKEAKSLVSQGVKEIILVAQDTTRFGEDYNNGVSLLPELLKNLCEIEDLKWVRLLYCYPERISDELIDVIASNEKIVNYLDIPIQHSNDQILKAMNRKSTNSELVELMNKLRNKIPNIVIRTTFIAGFPGETDDQFIDLLTFAVDTKFERMGCFAYSPEEGTRAAIMENQVDEEVKLSRCDLIMEKQYEIMHTFNENQVGKTFDVLVEGFDKFGGCFFGRSYMDAPDIDGKIFFDVDSDEKPKSGDFVKVKIDEVIDYDLFGKLIND